MAKVKLSESKINKIKEICASFGNQPGEAINVLHKVQGEFGYLPAEVQELIAMELNVPVATIYGIVTFYSFFTMIPKGEHPISVCMGTACYVRGAEKVLDEFKRQYYAVCENTTNINTKQEETDKIEIYDVKIVYNGICVLLIQRRELISTNIT